MYWCNYFISWFLLHFNNHFFFSLLRCNSLPPSHDSLCSVLLVDTQFSQKCHDASDETNKEKYEDYHKGLHRKFFLRVINKCEDNVRKGNLKRNWIMLKMVQQSTYLDAKGKDEGKYRFCFYYKFILKQNIMISYNLARHPWLKFTSK